MTTRVPVGATVAEVYFNVPYFHGYGSKHETHEAVVAAARARKDRVWEQNLLATKVYIDERWAMRWTNPDGTTGGLDLLVERTEFAPNETRDDWLAARERAAQVPAGE